MIRLIEELSLNAWPALQTVLYDGWVLRFADGYTRDNTPALHLYRKLAFQEAYSYWHRVKNG